MPDNTRLKEFIIGSKEAGQSAEKFLKKAFPAVPASFWYKAIRKNGLKINGKHLKDIKTVLLEGDSLLVYHLPSDALTDKADSDKTPVISSKLQDQLNKIRVVYEDDNLLVLDKPAGVLSQKAHPEDYSINEWANEYLRKNGYVAEPGYKPGVINRLDQPTRGLILFPKDLATAQELSALIRTGAMGKYYFAIVHCPQGAPKWNKRLLRHFWIKDERINKVALSDAPTGQNDAQEVLSEATLLEDYGDSAKIELKLITGKSHQLRAQLAHEGYPIVGDRKYGVNDGVEELGLVAWKVEFNNKIICL